MTKNPQIAENSSVKILIPTENIPDTSRVANPPAMTSGITLNESVIQNHLASEVRIISPAAASVPSCDVSAPALTTGSTEEPPQPRACNASEQEG